MGTSKREAEEIIEKKVVNGGVVTEKKKVETKTQKKNVRKNNLPILSSLKFYKIM